MNNILEKCKTTRILAVIGIVCMFLGTIFSYVSYSIWGYNYEIALWDYMEGKIILVLVIVNLIFIFKDYIEKYAPKLVEKGFWQKIASIKSSKASLISTVLSAAFAIYLTLKLDVEFSNYSLGFYSLWIGVIALVAYAILHKNNDDFQMKM